MQRKPLLHFHFFTFAKRLARFARHAASQTLRRAVDLKVPLFTTSFWNTDHRASFRHIGLRCGDTKNSAIWCHPFGTSQNLRTCTQRTLKLYLLSRAPRRSASPPALSQLGVPNRLALFHWSLPFFAAGSSSPTSFVVACDPFFFRSTAKRSPTPA